MIFFYVFSLLLFVLAFVISFLFRDNTVKHTIKYENRKLIIDDFWVIASFRNGSLNCEIFEYLYKNKDRTVYVEELVKNIFRGRDVNCSKIIDSMGVRGDMKKILFTHTSESITYHPDKVNSQKNIRVN